MMAAEIELHGTSLPPDAGQWSREDFVAAWHENDNRAAWNRALLAAAFEDSHGDLRWYAEAVNVGYQTLKNYRSVAKKYAGCPGAGTVPFGVAETLAGQPDRLELVSRAEPWTVAEARHLVASRRQLTRPAAGGKSTDVSTVVQAEVEGSGQDARADSGTEPLAGKPQQPAAAREVVPAGSPPSGVSPQQPPVLAAAKPPQLTRPAAGGKSTDVATGDSTKPPSAPGPVPCQRCQDLEAENARLAAENARLREQVTDLTAENARLVAVVRERDKQVADLTAQLDKRPAPAAATELLTAELEFVAADRDRLAARVRELEGEVSRLREAARDGQEPSQTAQDAPEPAGPAPGPPAPGKAPDSRQERAGGAPEPSGPCGGRVTDRVQVVVAGRRLRIRAPDGTEIEWLCRAHQRELAGRVAGAQILPAPGSENDLWEFRYGTCQFWSRAVVAA